jgi:hypothetical protein
MRTLFGTSVSPLDEEIAMAGTIDDCPTNYSKTPISISMSPPRNASYVPPPSYTDDESLFSNNDLCPRYADADPSSAPPSPASVESFDILESIPWRRSYIAPGSYTHSTRRASPREILLARWKQRKVRVVVVGGVVATTLLALLLILFGITAAGHLALRDAKSKG